MQKSDKSCVCAHTPHTPQCCARASGASTETSFCARAHTETPDDIGQPVTIGELLDRIEARVGKTLRTPHTDDAKDLQGEEAIHWVPGFDPAGVRYVRETVQLWCPRRRGPMRWQGFRVVGWSNLAHDAPNSRGSGYFARRVFWLKDYDAPAPGPYGASGAPSEGVDPLTIFPGKPGDLTERAWGRRAN